MRVIEPMFESQTKIKLGSLMMAPTKDKDGHPFPLSGVSVNKFVGDFIKEQVDNYLHKNLDTAEVMLQKIQDSERDRKAMAGVTKLARERAKKANLHNAKLRDCRIHLNEAPKKGYDKDNDPRFATPTRKPSFRFAESRSIALVRPRKSFTRTRNFRSCSRHST